MHPLQNLTVLLVEDTWQIRNLLTSILTQLGFGKVIRASNGAEAIQLIKLMRDNPVKAGFSNIDLVLSDWVMDPVDGPCCSAGFAVIRRARIVSCPSS